MVKTKHGGDVSDRILVGLLIFSITFFSIGSLIMLFSGSEPASPTGHVFANRTNENATASLYVNGTVYLNLTDSAIAFGNMELGRTLRSEDFATVDSNFRGDGNGTGTLGDFFNVSNEGSVYINISAYFTNTTLFTTPTGGANSFPNDFFQIHGNWSDNGNKSGVICVGNVNVTYGSVPTTFATRRKVIMDLDHTERNNSALIGLNISVPADEGAGGRQVSVILIGEQTAPLFPPECGPP